MLFDVPVHTGREALVDIARILPKFGIHLDGTQVVGPAGEIRIQCRTAFDERQLAPRAH
jgi:hypothetical protein